MFEATIGGEKVKAEVTFWTARLYELEFGGDLVADFYGKQELDLEGGDAGEGTVTLDFTKVDWNALTRILWASAKTADESAPGYEKWLKAAKGMDALAVRGQLDEEIADCFFRPEAAEEDA